MGNPLKTIREEKGWTQEQAAEALGMSRSGYIKKENGDRRMTLDDVARAAKAFDVSPSLFTPPDRQSEVFVPILGRVGADVSGRVLYAEGQGTGDFALIAPGADAGNTAIEVVGHSMRGYADDGSLIYHDEPRAPEESFLGEVVVCWLATGEVVVKRLLRGSEPGLWDLQSFYGADLSDVVIERIAEITSIVPRRRAQKLIRRGHA